MCNGYWDRCKCEDCSKARELYQDLDWFKDDEEMVKEIENKLKSMGYSI